MPRSCDCHHISTTCHCMETGTEEASESPVFFQYLWRIESWLNRRWTPQLQVLGFLLSIMNICLNVIAPKVSLMSEARFDNSYVQDYDAILRNSIVLSHTGYLWLAVLLAMIALPTGLRSAYMTLIRDGFLKLMHVLDHFCLQIIHRGVTEFHLERYRRTIRPGRTGTSSKRWRSHWRCSYGQRYSALPGSFCKWQYSSTIFHLAPGVWLQYVASAWKVYGFPVSHSKLLISLELESTQAAFPDEPPSPEVPWQDNICHKGRCWFLNSSPAMDRCPTTCRLFRWNWQKVNLRLSRLGSTRPSVRTATPLKAFEMIHLGGNNTLNSILV